MFLKIRHIIQHISKIRYTSSSSSRTKRRRLTSGNQAQELMKRCAGNVAKRVGKELPSRIMTRKSTAWPENN